MKRSRSAEDATDGANARYEIGRVLGEGAFAVVRQATDRKTGETVAIKQISHERSRQALVDKEVSLLKAAGRHANIVGLIDAFDTPRAAVLVLELARGGEVFDRISQHGPFSELTAARVVQDVASGLAHLHARFICHRDLKIENLLYVSPAEDAHVKIADFGLAQHCGGPHPAKMTDFAGTNNYLAPELCRGEPFGIEVDCWALGVVLFTLLGAYMPFDPHSNANDATVRARIVRGVPAFTEGEGGYPQQWRHVSTAAQDIIRRLLEVDASKRLTAAEALGQPWVCGDDAHCPSTPIPDSDEQLRRFNDARRVWRLAADAVALVVRAPLTTAAVGASVAAAAAGGASGSATAECLPATSAKGGGGSGGGEAPPAAGGAGTITLPDEARRELKAAFDQFDEDKSGEIELEELKGACRVLGAKESEAEAMLFALDTDHDGGISFDEFLRAAAPLYLSSRAAIQRCFDFFDTDCSGYIDATELEVVLCRLGWSSSHGRVHKDVLERIFDTADTNHDGQVSFAEFMALFASAGTTQVLDGASAESKKRSRSRDDGSS